MTQKRRPKVRADLIRGILWFTLRRYEFVHRERGNQTKINVASTCKVQHISAFIIWLPLLSAIITSIYKAMVFRRVFSLDIIT